MHITITAVVIPGIYATCYLMLCGNTYSAYNLSLACVVK